MLLPYRERRCDQDQLDGQRTVKDKETYKGESSLGRGEIGLVGKGSLVVHLSSIDSRLLGVFLGEVCILSGTEVFVSKEMAEKQYKN